MQEPSSSQCALPTCSSASMDCVDTDPVAQSRLHTPQHTGVMVPLGYVIWTYTYPFMSPTYDLSAVNPRCFLQSPTFSAWP